MRHLIWILLLCLNAPFAFAALDLNTASEAELDALPGVGPSRAQAIIEYRKAHGRFASVDELGSVRGIGDKTLSELKPLLTVGVVTPTAPSASPMPEGSPVRPATGSSGGFPWWVVVVGVILGIVVFVFMRRRAAPAQPELPAAPEASAPVRKPSASVPPRPAASAPVMPPEPSARPAGAPPRPAGSPSPQASAASSGVAPSAGPKPAGVPPKPAGSR